jgi:ethanolamine ammonia-lyase large subunit
MAYKHLVGSKTFLFPDLKKLMAKATPLRSGDILAGVAAESAQERVAAQKTLADLPLKVFLNEVIIPYETDEVTRLIVDTHDSVAFEPIAHLTVGGFRDWLLSPAADGSMLTRIAPGVTPEMAAAVSKIMRLQDLIIVGAKCRVVTKFRNTIGLEGRLSTRVQPNHPTDDPRGVAASMLDGLLLGGGDAVIGINPATDNVDACVKLLTMIDELRKRFDIPTQSCVLTHVTNAMQAMERGAPMDIVFQSVAGTEAANRGFGIDLAMLKDAHQMALGLGRGTVGNNVMYFETGQGSALSSNTHHGADQQTIEARAYAVARAFDPFLVNTVVGFIGPEYLYDGKQITRAGLEDHFCGKLLGLPMGCDICYTNHAEADQDDMDALLTLMVTAGCTFIMGVPGADDIMLNYQSTSFHDALYVRKALGKRPAPEFEEWLVRMGLFDESGQRLAAESGSGSPVVKALAELETKSIALNGVMVASSEIWSSLRKLTPARIGIEPTGVSQPTSAHLDFQWDHAQARDAVNSELDGLALAGSLDGLELEAIVLKSTAIDRKDYLQHPDHGRRLEIHNSDFKTLSAGRFDVVFVIADGLSATAVNRHAVPMLNSVVQELRDENWSIAPVVIAPQGRFAIGDDIAALVGAEMAVVLIGERPGLTSPDSLGIYITLHPKPGSLDSERNCISNVRPEGLPYSLAAKKLLFLMREARRIGVTGIALKEDAGSTVLEDNDPALIAA